MLNNTNITIKEAFTKEEIISVCSSNNINIILLNIYFTGEDIVKIIQTIKEINSKTPIIAIAAIAIAGDSHKCLQAGCIDYIAKPFSELYILEKIKEYIL